LGAYDVLFIFYDWNLPIWLNSRALSFPVVLYLIYYVFFYIAWEKSCYMKRACKERKRFQISSILLGNAGSVLLQICLLLFTCIIIWHFSDFSCLNPQGKTVEFWLFLRWSQIVYQFPGRGGVVMNVLQISSEYVISWKACLHVVTWGQYNKLLILFWTIKSMQMHFLILKIETAHFWVNLSYHLTEDIHTSKIYQYGQIWWCHVNGPASLLSDRTLKYVSVDFDRKWSVYFHSNRLGQIRFTTTSLFQMITLFIVHSYLIFDRLFVLI